MEHATRMQCILVKLTKLTFYEDAWRISSATLRRVLPAGQVVAGRYRVDKRIAQGGMGAIFLAEHMATEEKVALKVLWPHVLGSKAAVESFQLEARVTARLGSENIVRILDAGFDADVGMPFLAMELLHGVTLRALVDRTGPLSPPEALAIMSQVARALSSAHLYVDRTGRQSPIVHRDLKPENLFVALHKESYAVVKVLDFGLAKILSASQLDSHEIKGTPLYMAPEQFSHGPVTPKLDIWAFGLIAFYLLTGRTYWLTSVQTDGIAPLLNEVLVKPLESPTERLSALGGPAALPAEFDAWFLRCLERDPQSRFASTVAAFDAFAQVFTSSSGADAAGSAEAASKLARRTALALESSPKANESAKGPLPPTPLAHVVDKAAPSPPVPTFPLTTFSPSATTGNRLDAPQVARRQRTLWGGWTVGTVLGVGAGLCVALTVSSSHKERQNGNVDVASASATSAKGVDVPPADGPLPPEEASTSEAPRASTSAAEDSRSPAPPSSAGVRPGSAPTSKSTKAVRTAEPEALRGNPPRDPRRPSSKPVTAGDPYNEP